MTANKFNRELKELQKDGWQVAEQIGYLYAKLYSKEGYVKVVGKKPEQ